MSTKDTKTEISKSNSQIKREQRKKEVASARRNARLMSIIGWAFVLVVIALIAWGVVSLIQKENSKVQMTDNYSAGLDENGYISGVKASSKVTLPNYKGLTVPYSEIEYTDAQIDTDIENLVAGYKYASDDASLKVADGDTVNIAYVGTIDGELFDGGSSDSYDLEIGSGSFIDDFEEQLIGAQNGSQVTVEVTFPEDYQSADVAGMDAVFEVTINSITVIPEFTDEFVAEKLSDYATTVDEYREYLRTTNEEENLNTWIRTYLIDNSTVSSYSNKYLKAIKAIQKYDDMQSYEYINQMYEAYLGYSYYGSFEDYAGMTEAEYDESLKDIAKDTAKENMIYQAIVETEGVTADAAYYKQVLKEEGREDTYYDSQVELTGEPFVLQQAIKAKAMEIIVDSVVIQK